MFRGMVDLFNVYFLFNFKVKKYIINTRAIYDENFTLSIPDDPHKPYF